jgi:hypothetical protein
MATATDIQRRLHALGFYQGKIDGNIGPLTLSAISSALDKVAPGPASIPATTKSEILIPDEWMPPAKMQGIIFHWTAGVWNASGLDRTHYHFLLEDDAKLVRGDPTIKENETIKRGQRYAAHTLGCNTGFIGFGLCGMNGAIEKPFNAGKYPITRTQWEALPHGLAALCRRYEIPVTPKTVLSHAEVQTNLGKRQKGKWDVSILPFAPEFNTAKKCGDDMRARVSALLR